MAQSKQLPASLMDEALSHSRSRELEAVAPRSNHLLRRVSNAAKLGPAHRDAPKDAQATPSLCSSPSPIDPFVCYDSAPSKDAQATPSPHSSPSPIDPFACFDMAPSPSPRSSRPSPIDPFVCFDSAPSTSPSHVVDGKHWSTCDAREAQMQNAASESYPSSATARRLPAGSLEFAIDNVCSKKVSLEQHLRHGDLPAGSLEFAIDNVCCKKVSLEQHLRHGDVDPEQTKHSFILERFLPAAKTVAADHDRTAYSVGKPAMMLKISPILRSSSTAKMPADTASSELDASKYSAIEYLPHCNQDDDDESVNAEMLAKSCGFFWAGLWRSTMSCTHNMAHAPLKDLVTKKRIATQLAGHRRRSLKEDLQPKVKITLMEGIQRQEATFEPDLIGLSCAPPSAEKLSQSMSSSSGGYCNYHPSKFTNFNSGPLANLFGDCQSNRFSHQVPPSAKQYLPCDATSNRQSIASSCLSYTHQSFEDCNLYTECHVTENAPRCSCCSVSAHDDDDELEFHDASSRLDMLCTQSSNSYSQESKSANYQDPSLSAQISGSDVNRLFEAHLPSTKGKYILTDDKGLEKGVRNERSKKDAKERPKVVNPALASKCNYSSDSQHTSSGFAETANGAHMNSHEKNTVHSRKKCLASSLPGWPLGISSLQSGRNKILSQEAEYVHDISAAKTSNHKKSLSMELLPPPLPPSPTTSPWLGKALALKASKPPYLATLQQQHNVGSVQKKQLFNVSLDEKKGVKWEDVVKRSK